MGKFDLEKVIANLNVKTLGGKKAIYDSFDLSETYPLIFLITVNGIEEPFNYTLDGKFFSAHQESEYDLCICDNENNEYYEDNDDDRIGINDKINPELLKKRFRDWI
jgi:hypothetical protein